MILLALAGVLLLTAAIFAPQYWVRHVLQRHGTERPDFPGTGGELAQHLVGELKLEGVGVERTDKGDHYDPKTKMVRLSPAHFDGKSVAAVAVAAHEVGHAVQHANGERMLELRQKLVAVAASTDLAASAFFLAAPLLAVFAHTPLVMLLLIGCGIALLGVRLVAHLVTLPVEMDASFGKALPVLEQGGFLSPQDLPAARQVLRAAALTYVAAALASLLNMARWIRFWR